MPSLQEHMNEVSASPTLGGCDFKLASASTIPTNTPLAKEVGFDCLSIRVVQELVSLGLHPSKCPSITNAGQHLSAVKFHKTIERAADAYNSGELSNFGKETSHVSSTVDTPNKVVILDVRNIYETRIGKFSPPQGVDFLDPKVRQYSDLPSWIDSNLQKLHDKCILMYCTGGVRCEMASAYLKMKGKGFQDVFQLSGGIQRYLEAFPAGGFFKGKNFVFDHRVAVASSCNEVIGSCLHCASSFDDYSSRSRCLHCRMLLLICHSCQDRTTCDNHMCELCFASGTVLPVQHKLTAHYVGGSPPSERTEKSKVHSWEVVPVQERSLGGLQILRDAGMESKQRLRILCLHGFRQNASNLKGRLASFAKKLKDIIELVFVNAPHEIPSVYSTAGFQGETLCIDPRHNRKYAWLVTPGMISSSSRENKDECSRANISFDPYQYKQQTAGWSKSLCTLSSVISELGPFDGLMGFSQGAAVAAAICFPQDLTIQLTFQFVILCSGFLSPASEHQNLTPVPCSLPSLHLFGEKEGRDRQISVEDSLEVVSLFDPLTRVVLKHNSGHIVPCQKEYIAQVRAFLEQFL